MTEPGLPVISREQGGTRRRISVTARLPNGARNQLLREDLAIHNWYRFVLSFPPHLVREYLHRFGVASTDTVLDPFCGTGTTLVECKKLGVKSVGLEAHPMARFASAVKTDWSPDPDRLGQHAQLVAGETLDQFGQESIEDNPVLETGQRPTVPLRRLPPEVARLLITNTISDLPLHKTLVLQEHLRSCHDNRYSAHERLALAKALVDNIGNLHFGPEVGVGRKKKDAPVVAAWLAQVRRMAVDLRATQSDGTAPCAVLLADAREIDPNQLESPVQAVFTSPPYPNEKDYTRTTRLESVLLGFVQSREELTSLKKGLIRSNTRNVYRDDADDTHVECFSEIQRVADQIENRRKELGKTSGFERMYHRVTRQYFGGMHRHLASLRSVLSNGAYLGYVVGDQASYLRVMIRTGKLLSQIATSLGYEVVSIDLFRTRLATATGEQLREEVVVLRWPG